MPVTMTGSPQPKSPAGPTTHTKAGAAFSPWEGAQGDRKGGLKKDASGNLISLQGQMHEQAEKMGYVDKRQELVARGLQTEVAKFEGQTAKMYDDNKDITSFDSYQVAGEVRGIGGREMVGEGNSGKSGYHGIYDDIIRDQSNELTEQEELMSLLQVDMDEHEQDLIEAKKAIATMLDTDGDGVVEDDEQFSPELEALFKQMNSYSSRYNVDLFRSLKENGGKFTQDGNGAMVKTKFRSVLLSSFVRMRSCFTETMLDEICTKFGTGPPDPMTGNFLDIKWRLFCNYVGERYMTFPPIR